jgi:hypothetical protein
MANALYHKLPDNSYMNISCPGGPAMWRVEHNSDQNYYAKFTWDCVTWITFPTPFATPALAQTALDNVITNINAGIFQ